MYQKYMNKQHSSLKNKQIWSLMHFLQPNWQVVSKLFLCNILFLFLLTRRFAFLQKKTCYFQKDASQKYLSKKILLYPHSQIHLQHPSFIPSNAAQQNSLSCACCVDLGFYVSHKTNHSCCRDNTSTLNDQRSEAAAQKWS